jgi:hypothetical protein
MLGLEPQGLSLAKQRKKSKDCHLQPLLTVVP